MLWKQGEALAVARKGSGGPEGLVRGRWCCYRMGLKPAPIAMARSASVPREYMILQSIEHPLLRTE
jgi:hypothetical protein